MQIKTIFTTVLMTGTLYFSTPSIGIAKSSVWKASKNNQHLFIAGTVHILAADDYPLPCEFGAAYSVADKLFFETDISPERLAKAGIEMLSKGRYPQGENIANHLSESTTAALKNYLSSLNLPAEQFLNFKPGMLLSVVTIAELSRLGIQTEGVDQFLFNRAKQDNKPTDYFEEPSEQIDFLVKLGIGNEENFVKYMLDNAQKLENQYLGMRESWRNGNIDLLADFGEVDELRENFPKVFATLLTNRNQQWLKRIDALIDTPEVEYILVGALHLPEKEGLLAQLTSKGYQIDQVSCEYKQS